MEDVEAVKVPLTISAILEKHRPDLGPYEELYQEIHANPELSDFEGETAELVAGRLHKLSATMDVRTHIGGHGLAGIWRNGPGKTVLLRADMDALPVREETGVPYASTKTMKDAEGVMKPVMHACGHDIHVTSLLATAQLLISAHADWSGTVIFLFQPAEERGTGAQAMVDDGLYVGSEHNVPIPDLVLGQHVLPLRADRVVTKPGSFMSAADSFKVTVYGRGGHGSQPNRTIDPVLIASHIVVRLQSIVSREVPPDETAVVTVGAIHAGSVENIIAEEAILKIDIRSLSERWREKILDAVQRIVKAECRAGNCPREPRFERTRTFPLTDNDAGLTAAVTTSFQSHFGANRRTTKPILASEDCGILGSAVSRPYCYWGFGGVALEEYDEKERAGTLADIPYNHSPHFLPVIQPTLKTGTDAMAVAALTFLAPEGGKRG